MKTEEEPHPHPRVSYALPKGGHVTVDANTPAEKVQALVEIWTKLEEELVKLSPEEFEELIEKFNEAKPNGQKTSDQSAVSNL